LSSDADAIVLPSGAWVDERNMTSRAGMAEVWLAVSRPFVTAVFCCRSLAPSFLLPLPLSGMAVMLWPRAYPAMKQVVLGFHTFERSIATLTSMLDRILSAYEAGWFGIYMLLALTLWLTILVTH